MSCIVYQTNKKTGVVYAYESESYRDPVTRKPTSRRTYLGRVDPVTKAIIGKAEAGKRNRMKICEEARAQENKTVKESAKRVEELEMELEKLKAKMNQMNNYQKKVNAVLKRIVQLINDIQAE